MQRDCTNCSPDDYWRLCPSLALDPGNPGVVYVGTSGSDIGGVNGAVYKTVNGGDHWTSVFGTADSHVIAVSITGTFLRYDGNGWSPMGTADGESFTDLWGLAEDDYYAAGLGGALWHYDGASWSSVDLSNLSEDLLGVWGAAADDLYVTAGFGGLVLHYDGTGVIAGNVWDHDSALGIDGVTVSTDLGNNCRSIPGEYMMVVPAGVFDLFASAESYETASVSDLPVVGSEVTWQNFSMRPGSGTGPPTSGGGGGGGSGCFIGGAAREGCRSRLGGPIAALPAVIALLYGVNRRPLFFLF
jgi:hypothetical protein